VGLLYDDASLDAAYDLVKDWSASERQALRDAVPKLALSAPFRGGIVNDLARQALDLSRAGLKQRARRDHHSFDETRYLAPLESFVDHKRTSAESWLEAYHKRWGEKIDPIFTEAEI
jgi:glutamate--cysteine ligase